MGEIIDMYVFAVCLGAAEKQYFILKKNLIDQMFN